MADEALLERLLVAEDIICQSSDHIALEKITSFLQLLVWREKIAQWFYDVTDYIDEPRAVVYVAMDILDRYSATRMQDDDIFVGKNYKIAAMTAIYLAIRVAGKNNLQVADLIRASRGNFGVHDVSATGKSMLQCLTWGIRIVTPHDFVDAILQCLSSKVPEAAKTSLRESAMYLVELSVYDAYFTKMCASKVAMAAMLNIAEKTADDFTSNELAAFCDALSQVTHTGLDSMEMRSIKRRLRSLHNRVEMQGVQQNPLHYISDEESYENTLSDEEEDEATEFDGKHGKRNSLSSFTYTKRLEDSTEGENPDHIADQVKRKRKRCQKSHFPRSFSSVVKHARRNK